MPRERSWKLKQSKRWASHAIKSNLSLENRHVHRLQQEETAQRKLAKSIAQQVTRRAGGRLFQLSLGCECMRSGLKGCWVREGTARI